jgi:hypothetical protein
MLHPETRVELIGGATVPVRTERTVFLSWPLVVLELDGETLRLKFRANWVKALAKFLLGARTRLRLSEQLEWFSVPCSKITQVRIAKRSVIVKTEIGDFCFGSPRFLPSSPGKIQLLADELESRQVQLEIVSSNFLARNDMKSIAE